jgi:hypothetical protein
MPPGVFLHEIGWNPKKSRRRRNRTRVVSRRIRFIKNYFARNPAEESD